MSIRTQSSDVTTEAVIDRFNRAFQERDATLLEDIISSDCVMQSVQPAPDGTRYEGYDASFDSWQALIDDTTSHFEVVDVHSSGGEWAVVRRRSVWGPGPEESVRGVNVMRVVDGRIVEADGATLAAAMTNGCPSARFTEAARPRGGIRESSCVGRIDANMAWLSWAIGIVIAVAVVALQETGVLPWGRWKGAAVILAIATAVGLLSAAAVS